MDKTAKDLFDEYKKLHSDTVFLEETTKIWNSFVDYVGIELAIKEYQKYWGHPAVC